MTEGFPCRAHLFRQFNTLDAAPSLAILRQYLAHLVDWVVNGTGIAESSFSHQFFLSASGTLLGMVGLFVSPIATEQPARMFAKIAEAIKRAKKSCFIILAYHAV